MIKDHCSEKNIGLIEFHLEFRNSCAAKLIRANQWSSIRRDTEVRAGVIDSWRSAGTVFAK